MIFFETFNQVFIKAFNQVYLTLSITLFYKTFNHVILQDSLSAWKAERHCCSDSDRFTQSLKIAGGFIIGKKLLAK